MTMNIDETITALKSVTRFPNNTINGSSSLIDDTYFDGQFDLEKTQKFLTSFEIYSDSVGCAVDRIKIANFGGRLTGDAFNWYTDIIKDKNLTYEELVDKFKKKYCSPERMLTSESDIVSRTYNMLNAGLQRVAPEKRALAVFLLCHYCGYEVFEKKKKISSYTVAIPTSPYYSRLQRGPASGSAPSKKKKQQQVQKNSVNSDPEVAGIRQKLAKVKAEIRTEAQLTPDGRLPPDNHLIILKDELLVDLTNRRTLLKKNTQSNPLI
ncbi:hypothetical protein CANARDRAFT_211017 [[Candida] arabinofermentans NRRL YB-2248]|uniref:Uncharacterized protein n=1 Tax=[Candida] arabinofermentans NRRL YB-2248 TaxID=983967 RepID=A0A1E4T724_9ASCO|nr:hypothetical protein CANARDRAFT_211017 [[Candida] arabinofermentans NRRL YB-2248]